MIRGLGIDLCSHNRMKARIKDEHFVNRIFVPEEISYAMTGRSPERHFASSFAAREAFKKASGAEFFSVVFHGVWLERSDKGVFLRLSKKIIRMNNILLNCKIHVSLSHENGMAVAIVILEE